MILNREDIKKLITEKNMITGYKNLDIQIQPNGFDLTVFNFFTFKGYGVIDFDNVNRYIPTIREVPMFEHDKYKEERWFLVKGVYLFEINETLSLPKNVCAISMQRSSIMRSGCDTNVGHWDAGYRGKGYSILNVNIPNGIMIYKNARILNIIFMTLHDETTGYDGIFQDENIEKLEE